MNIILQDSPTCTTNLSISQDTIIELLRLGIYGTESDRWLAAVDIDIEVPEFELYLPPDTHICDYLHWIPVYGGSLILTDTDGDMHILDQDAILHAFHITASQSPLQFMQILTDDMNEEIGSAFLVHTLYFKTPGES